MLTMTERPRLPGAAARAASGFKAVDRGVIDAQVIEVFEDRALLGKVRRLERVELGAVWRLTEQAIARHGALPVHPLSSMEVHRRMVEGLPGTCLLIASSMILSTLGEVEDYFGMSFKTIKARLEGSLDTATSEQAMRVARVAHAAAQVFGGFDAARGYLHTRNFALGGAAPADLLKTAEGERIVLGELQTQAEGGPL